jgi:hypothetical protein
VIWTIGAFASGPLHLGRIPCRGNLARPVGTPIAIGLIAAAVFVLGGLVVREVEALRALIDRVLDHARLGSLPLVVVLTRRSPPAIRCWCWPPRCWGSSWACSGGHRVGFSPPS